MARSAPGWPTVQCSHPPTANTVGSLGWKMTCSAWRSPWTRQRRLLLSQEGRELGSQCTSCVHSARESREPHDLLILSPGRTARMDEMRPRSKSRLPAPRRTRAECLAAHGHSKPGRHVAIVELVKPPPSLPSAGFSPRAPHRWNAAWRPCRLGRFGSWPGLRAQPVLAWRKGSPCVEPGRLPHGRRPARR